MITARSIKKQRSLNDFQKGMIIKMDFKTTSLIALLIYLVNYSANAQPSSFADFDPMFVQGGGDQDKIDVSQYRYGNPINAGTYDLDVYVNDQYRGNIPLKFIGNNGKNDINKQLCVSTSLLSLFDLKKVFHEVTGRDCQQLSHFLPQASVRLDFSVLRLNVTIPQALVNARPEDYVSPDIWQAGTTAAFLSYDFNNYQYRYNNTEQSSNNLQLNGGINIAGWALRHDGSFFATTGTQSRYSAQRTYLQRDIVNLKARITLGDFVTNNTVMDSLSLRGVQIASDSQMLPQSERGFAPEVRGVANSNARIQIRQADNLIYETVVPPGPFNISNLYATGSQGSLNVKILESDGTSRTFIVPYAATSGMLRPGINQYQIAMGQYRYGDKTFGENVFNGVYQVGLSNLLTANVGTILHRDYKSYLLGAGLNLPVGSLTTDITVAHSVLDNERKRGYSLRNSYSVVSGTTGTNFSLAAFRYNSEDYYSLNNFMFKTDKRYLESNDINYRSNPKKRYQVSVSQPFYQGFGSIYANIYRSTYWDSGSDEQFQIGYSNTYKRISYDVGINKNLSDNRSSASDTQIYFHLSVPLGSDFSSPSISLSNSYLKGQGNSMLAVLNGSAGEQRQFNYAVSSSMYSYQDNNFAVSGGYNSPYARLQGSASGSHGGNSQSSIGISGGVVGHKYGVTLANYLGDTFAIVHAKDGKGAAMGNESNNQLDYWGNGIFNSLTPYEYNRIALNTQKVSPEVTFSSTGKDVVPRKNAIILVNFQTDAGIATLVNLLRPSGNEIPMGASIYNGDKYIGDVAQNGQAFLKNIKDGTLLEVKWGNRACSFTFVQPHSTKKNKAGFFMDTQQCREEAK